MTLRVPILLLALAGCASIPPADVPLIGRWGGPHIGLELTSDGGTLDYDCAAGRIEGPVLPRGDGTFEAQGKHTPSTGGPERVGEVRPTYEALYGGTVRGDRMTLLVRVENGVLIGPLTLRRGAEPVLFRCL